MQDSVIPGNLLFAYFMILHCVCQAGVPRGLLAHGRRLTKQVQLDNIGLHILTQSPSQQPAYLP